MTIRRISHDRLRVFVHDVFVASGADELDAASATDVLMWASLRGVDTHGVRNLKRYYIDSAGGVGRRDGVICNGVPLTVERDSPTTATTNANGGMGLSASVKAMNLAIEKATAHGTGVVTVRNSTHFGAAGYYAHMATQHDMIGFASTGYLFPNGQPKAVAPFGGLLPMLSTNPLAMACPAGTGPAFVLDMSTSVVPVNRIEMLEELGKALPLGWALDDQHQPTSDPATVEKMVPLGGATEFGGHKGFGLAIAGWILTGLLSGAWRENPDPNRVLGDNKSPGPDNGFAQEGIGHFFAALRLDRFGDPDTIKQGLDAMIQTFNESPPAPGFDCVMIPGQPEFKCMQNRLRDGIPLTASTVSDLSSLAEQFDITLLLDDDNTGT
ncbi:MAG: Ldh family oxidoreductase [Fuerstiella sp.]|nr:Ldh family oxidoreductase [Fuerstiella sp.]MCP4858017.1 Ldh family oxidoreductase [Fuerstiella sp.]